ncbi:hypothetical protein CLAIMM_04134 [Cladophialophora immunda]|nr:hypothetical protein CLAIMM_04134 [Cladophialophora immunda]
MFRPQKIPIPMSASQTFRLSGMTPRALNKSPEQSYGQSPGFAVRGLDVSGIGVATARWHKSTIPRILPVSNLHSGDLPGWKDLTHSCTSHKYADAWAQKT